MLAASTKRIRIVLDHGQDRLRSHATLRSYIFTRPPWAVSEKIVENMDVFEADHFVKTRQLPFRFETLRHALRSRAREYIGSACVMDLGAGENRPKSRDAVTELSRLGFNVANMLFETTNVVDPRGELAMAYVQTLLVHMPKAADPIVGDLFGEDSLHDLIDVTSLMAASSISYHSVVHQDFLHGIDVKTVAQSKVQSIIAECLHLSEVGLAA